MVHEVLAHLITDRDGVYVDGTVGSAGHSSAVGEVLSNKACLICLDRDPDAVRLSRQRLRSLGGRVKVERGNYGETDRILRRLGFQKVHGLLLDLGLSSYQLEQSGRGFSFNREEPLDMRMDQEQEGMMRASDLINRFSTGDLEKILRQYGEEKRARVIVRAIERARRKGPIDSSLQLARVIQSALPPVPSRTERHPATKTFQALRISVNRELDHLKLFLEKAPGLLETGGRLVVISYHSLEDRLVKRAMLEWEKGCVCPPDLPKCACGRTPLFRRIRKKGIRPGQGEIQDNPRARSAVLRAAERI
jgi:16S rRNA (cytosine1402-N4)-methyltransferase